MTVSITIEFPDEKHRDNFLGQVSDGAMEDMVDINPLNPDPDKKWIPFGGADKFYIVVDDEWLR